MTDLTYPGAGGTRDGVVPPGFRWVERSAVVGHGEEFFARARGSILDWGMQTGSGMTVEGRRTVEPGLQVRLRIPFGPLRVTAPAEVVYVVDEPRRAGFAYGTLPGHPERGEEAFLVELADDGTVTASIRAFSRPANWFWWCGYPFLRLAQEIFTRRYLTALR